MMSEGKCNVSCSYAISQQWQEEPEVADADASEDTIHPLKSATVSQRNYTHARRPNSYGLGRALERHTRPTWESNIHSLGGMLMLKGKYGAQAGVFSTGALGTTST